jgi:hypothetical protein
MEIHCHALRELNRVVMKTKPIHLLIEGRSGGLINQMISA